jgi:hypothetical protein
MTQYIRDGWHAPFSRAIRAREASASDLFQQYVGELQANLRDAIIGAPLDANAVLGSDGYTYGQMALAVYQEAMPEPYRNRSPVDPDDPAPFATRPHTVARHMVRWLQGHGELLAAPELERDYLQLMRQLHPEEIQARINREVAEAAALRRIEAERRAEQDREMERRIAGRYRELVQDLQQRLAPLRAQPARVPRVLGANLPPAAAALAAAAQERLRQMAHRLDEFEGGLQPLLQEMAAGPVRPRAAEIAAEAAAGREELAGFREQIREGLVEPIELIARQIQDFGAAALRDIQNIAQRDREAVELLQQEFREVHEEIGRLDADNRRLLEELRDVRVQADELRRNEILIQLAINEISAEQAKRKKNKIKRIMKTVAIIGACVFATWAIHTALASLKAGVVVAPTTGGGVGATAYANLGSAATKAVQVTKAAQAAEKAAHILNSARSGTSLAPWPH